MDVKQAWIPLTLAANLLGLALWAVAGVWWVGDLFGQFAWVWAAGAALAAVGELALLRKPSAATAVSVGVGLVHLGRILLVSRMAEPPKEPAFTVVVANVLTSNEEHHRLLEWVEQAEPDVVAVIELGHGWVADLGALRASHPYHREVPAHHNFGMGLYSRLPTEIKVEERFRLTELVAEIEGVELRVVHTMPPMGAMQTEMRDAHLVELRGELASCAGPCVVVGDLNATVLSKHFPADVGPLPGGTFPAGGPLRIGIDHALAAGGAVVGVEVGPAIGSDHLPLWVEVSR